MDRSHSSRVFCCKVHRAHQPEPAVRRRVTYVRRIVMLVTLLSGGAALAAAVPVREPAPAIAIDANYPGGNIVVERIEGDTVYLRPDLRDTEGWWFYWSFRVSRVGDIAASKRQPEVRAPQTPSKGGGAAGDPEPTLTFRFSGPNPIGVRGPAVSTDGGRTWAWLGTETVQEGAFQYALAADVKEVRFSFGIPYQQRNLQEFLTRHKGNPNIAVQELCRSGHGRSVERLHVGRLDGAAPFRVLVTARHHACEAMADYVLEGLLESILANDDEGYWFRRNVEVLAIPFVDKDGVEEGDQGKNRRPHDHNRDYSGPSVHASVAALRTFAPNWSNGRLVAAFDLHCPHIRGPHNEVIYLVGSEDERIWQQQQDFGRLLETLQGGPLVYRASDNLPFGAAWNTGASTGDHMSFGRWAGDLEGVRLAASFEFPYANAGGRMVTVDGARAFGRSLARALHAYLERIGKEQEARPAAVQPVSVNGVFPKLTVMAQGLGSNTEAGIGALIPWAQKLWAVGYVAHIRGQGLGLYEIGDDMTMRRHPASVTGTFANRLPHWPSGQAFIGPYAIDPDGHVRVIDDLKGVRLAATCDHLTDPANKVYFLGMEGRFWEVDVRSLKAKELFNLVKELQIDGTPHFKSAFTAQGRVVVANNTYDEQEFLGKRDGGRLAEWDGRKWTIVERNPFVEVHASAGSGSYGGNTLYAVGWTKSSVVLRALVKGQWQRYLLPEASHTWDHAWNTEWTRIRHAVTERLLMDAHGMFYELPAFAYGGHLWGIRPICSHLRVVPDFCYWRGLFVMASDQIDHDQGQPQSGLWFGNIDDLWRMGKPAGWGGPWWNTPVQAGETSDPFLMTGFDKKVLHFMHDANEPVRLDVEVDFLGDGSWRLYGSFAVAPAQNYLHHEFPDGFSAHWVRVRVDKACTATAYFMYR